MKIAVLASVAALSLAACDRAGEVLASIGLPDVSTHAGRCDLYERAYAAAVEEGVAVIVIPALDQELTLAELNTIVENACDDEA